MLIEITQESDLTVVDEVMLLMKSPAHQEFLYWVQRRQRTAFMIRWNLGAFQAADDAGYCLDRAEKNN